jgi:signal transduction histidine kinase
MLAFLSIQGVLDEQALIRQETVRRGGIISTGLASLVQEQFREAERAADSAAELARAEGFATNSASSAMSVCVVDRDYRLLFPASADVATNDSPMPEDGALVALQARIAPIEQSEAEGRFEVSYVEFERLLSAVTTPREKAVLLNCMARTRKKAGRLDEAAALYQRVIREFPQQSGPGGISLAVVAHLECVRAAALKNDDAKALRCIQALLDQIRLGQLPCRRSQFLFAGRTVAGWLTELGQRGRVSASEADVCRRQLDAINAILAAQAVAAVSLEATVLAQARTDGYGYVVSPSGLLGARWLSADRDRAVVFLIGREELQADFARRARATFAYAERFDYVISDGQGRVLLSSVEAAMGETHASVALGGSAPLSIAVHVVQSEAVRAHVQRRRILSLSAVGALVIMIATSLLFVMRIVRREREMSRMKDNFVASVSHEMRLPLATIKMVGEMFSFGKLDLPLCYVREIVMDREHETVSASMQDGTTVVGKCGADAFDLTTEFGQITVALKNIDRFGVRASLKVLPAELTKDLVLYYSFETDEVGKVTDASGKKNSGEVDGAKWVPQGKVGGAYEFDGQSSCIRVRDDATLNPKEQLTLSAWVKINAYGPTFPAIISKGNIGNYKESYGLYVSADGRLEFLVNGDGTAGGRTELYGSAIPLDAWTHVAATFNGRVMRLYVNGTESVARPNIEGKESGQESHAPVGWAYAMPPKPGLPSHISAKMPPPAAHAAGIFATSNPLLIGKADREGTSCLSTVFNGIIDEVMVYSRALTAEEVGNLYRAGGGQADGKPGEQKISVSGNGSADAGEVVKGQRYWFEASGLIGINVGGPNGGPAHKADPDGRAISQTDGTVTDPSPADARFPCPGLATHSLVGRIADASGAQPSRPSGNPPAKPALMQGKSRGVVEGEPAGLGVSDNGAAADYVQLGSKGSFVAPASGRLTLLCNDLIPGDNSGAWEVRIRQ